MRSKIFTGLLIGAVVVLLYLLLRKQESVREDGIAPVAKEAVRAEVENVKTIIDKKGFEHAVMEDKDNVIKTIRELDTSAVRQLDSVTRILNIERKNVKEWRQYSVTLEGKLLSASNTDTSFRYQDKWADIEYIRPKDTLSNGHFNFKYDADINYAEYWKRNWFLGAKKHYIDFWIADSRATVNGVKRIKIEAKQPSIRVDVNAHSFYTDRLNAGVEGGLSVGRTRLGAGYYYDFISQDWKPVVSLKFKILDF